MRQSNEHMDALMGVKYGVLDHGSVQVVDYMGTQDTIVSAARVSYGKQGKTYRSDRGLLRYLVRHRHTTPLEHCKISMHVVLPIFVARQWMRHRTGAFSEISMRYVEADPKFYRPEPVRPQSVSNKQGSSNEPIDQHTERMFWLQQDELQRQAVNAYDDAVEADVAKELARTLLPVNLYTEFVWSTDLHNLLHFLSLRLDSHAQLEIRKYAEVIARIVERWVPDVWEAFVDYRIEAHTFARQEMDAIRALIKAEVVHDMSEAQWDRFRMELLRDLSKREIGSFLDAIGVRPSFMEGE